MVLGRKDFHMDVKQLLYQVKTGEISVEEGEKHLKSLPYQSLEEFAKIDHHRKLRSGFSEVIFCSGKETSHLVGIYQSFWEKQEEVLGTRCSLEQFEAVAKVVPSVVYDANSNTLSLTFGEETQKEGLISICTGGTSDIAVAEEAGKTAEFFGSKVARFYDVGVAGVHRLYDQLPEITKSNVIIAVAGMEGALPGVLAGLVDVPVVALPTSVGYGTGLGGYSALLTMLNSCAEGIAVVNIDNGFGAGYLATQINRLALGHKVREE